MHLSNSEVAKEVKLFCSKIGKDPLLVQGAGGNVSWKEDEILWVKASGTWLAEADTNEIFVPVDLAHLQVAIANQDFNVKPVVLGDSKLRPSIETLLHGLMPHKIVVHVHAVEALTLLVQANAKEKLESSLDHKISWIYVDYFKPGADLARAVFKQLSKTPDAAVVFLGNHGVVIGGEDIEEVTSTLNYLKLKLQTKSLNQKNEVEVRPLKSKLRLQQGGYITCDDNFVSELALNLEMIFLLRSGWALYPDHVVFLDAKPVILEPDFSDTDLDKAIAYEPAYIFVIGEGVYQSKSVTAAQKSQLRCYYDVVTRLDRSHIISSLNDKQIFELLDWDAEKFRQNLAIIKNE